MKTICFFNTSKSWGGGEHWVYANSVLAIRNGYAVHVVTNETSVLGDRLDQVEGVSVHRFPVTNLSFVNPSIMFRLFRFFRNNDIDSVIFSLPNDVKAGGIAARCAQVGKIIYRRGIALPIRDTFLNRFLFRSIITSMICNSQETKRLVLQANPELIDPKNIVVIYNGFDIESFDAQPADLVYHRIGNEIIIGNAGRLTRQKGQHFAIDAVKKLQDRGHEVRLLIAGQGELEIELKQYAKTRGLGKSVFFLGFVESMKEFYQSIDILAHSALWEGFGYALVEAMATGKPIVAFDTSSNPEVIEDGITGILAKAEDVDDFADKIETLLLSDEKRQAFGNSGRKRVVEKFSSEKAFDRLTDFLAE